MQAVNFYNYKVYYKCIFTILFLLFLHCQFSIINSPLNYAYGQTRDNQLWSGIEIDIPFTKKIEAEVGQQVRLYDNMELVDWHITDIGLLYRFNKSFKASASYRYKFRKEAWQHVLYGNFYYDEKISKIKYTYRLRYYKKIRFALDKNGEEERKRDEDHLRNRIMFEYDTDTWIKPFTGFELFYLFNNKKYTDRFDVYRIYLGVNIDTFKKQELTLYWMYEEEFNINKPNISSVIGIYYSIDLPRLF